MTLIDVMSSHPDRLFGTIPVNWKRQPHYLSTYYYHENVSRSRRPTSLVQLFPGPLDSACIQVTASAHASSSVSLSESEERESISFMNILVIGSGGREHALLHVLRKTSSRSLQLFCAPGNPGIAQLATVIPCDATDTGALAQLAQERAIDLTIVGGEAPLAAGIVDEFERRGLAIAGATLAAARLESSKAFAKDFMARHHIPTARYKIADSASEAKDILRRGEFGAQDTPVVVKADGLAAGKGVVVARERAEALQAIDDLMVQHSAGALAARRVVIEETLAGPEASLLLFSDGREYALMPPARDHKRVGENDTGPNTGGMGAITDRGVIDDETLARARREIIEPTLRGALEDNLPFRGVLFVGLMLTADGPRVLEYNVRFGDPEAQAILVRLKSDLVEIFEAVARGAGL
ncbi:MAG: phosphoribosylamine---glycine ligase, partial [Blastocatellia bacterium]|nr:phosphoribosylamine---glycine ligase [Blastocatellia bacterium]